ncbi:transport protein particle component-domain-containing protein [Stachybotrys elegans]|uniref:Transport protein particle component-domain-containing protein n=1 Tax=Stachybotrys elegans TaxID=80388 RepID=A0A8K0WKX2_9HYPO|nr:transport protein particle component-domain-containing protein [Stachybotrys elegans]
MASPLPTITRQEASALVKQVQSTNLLNRQLSSVCQVNGLKSTGVKADLQRRIIDLIQETIDANDHSRFQQIRHSISHASAQRGSPSKAGTPARNSLGTSSQQQSPMTNYLHPNTLSPYNGQQTSYNAMSTSHRSIGENLDMFPHTKTSFVNRPRATAMAQHRNSITIPLKLNDHPVLQRCVSDTNYRVMVFCAGDTSGPQHVAFPYQSELRVNGGDIKANLRGLKNKPGSTRPVDITSALRLRPSYTNNIEFTYALTQKKFFLIINVCKVTSVSELVTTISTRRRIPKDSVIQELNKKAQDPDVVATSQVLSLKCPLSYMRLQVPCRSVNCTHIQCFDATSYLQLQEQGPQWLCPICNKSAPFEQLAVDEYVRDILEKAPKHLEAVTIEPNGRWLVKGSGDSSQGTFKETPFDDDEDELEISEVNVINGRRNETPQYLTPSNGTPASGGRDSSFSAPRGAASTSRKRPVSAVIDLTLSSDDEREESIQPPTKRQSTVTNGLRDTETLTFLHDDSHGELSFPTLGQSIQVSRVQASKPYRIRHDIEFPRVQRGLPYTGNYNKPPLLLQLDNLSTYRTFRTPRHATHPPVRKQQPPLPNPAGPSPNMSFESVMPPYNASDPSASFLSSSCLDFLLIELVPLAYRVTHDRDAPLLADSSASSPPPPPPAASKPSDAVSAVAGSSVAGALSTATAPGQRKMDEDEELAAVHYRLDMLGYRVGQGLVERFSRDRPRFNETLDVIKFVCKDLWSLVFGKNIDNLKTNHRGVYVLTDNVFRPFSRMSTEAGGQAVVRAQPFLWFPCGIVRGALAALGIVATVQAEINELPGAVFQIKTTPVK